MRRFMSAGQFLLEKGCVPDGLVRIGIRGLLKDKLKEERRLEKTAGARRKSDLVGFLRSSPIAVNTQDANAQHYELPTEFFRLVMGRHMKYSCGIWNEGTADLDTAERDMLELTVRRAEVADGQRILELGCGWGSLTLYLAEKFPASRITGVSNSSTQKEYILREARSRGLDNVRIITADMNDFTIDEQFDRVVSVEMFEHMRNYGRLFEKIAGFLDDGGKLFVHIFAHRKFAYLYEERDPHDWIGRYFFTGGLMPSEDLFTFFQEYFSIERQWRVPGHHYQKTAEAWLKNTDRNKARILPILRETYGPDQFKTWWIYWRVFFMSCAELWGYQKGTEWVVCHYLFTKRGA